MVDRLRARVRQAWRQRNQQQTGKAAAGRAEGKPQHLLPLPATPERITVCEGAHYRVALGSEGHSLPGDHRAYWGLLALRLPFDGTHFLPPEALRTIQRRQHRAGAGALTGIVGYLGVSHDRGAVVQSALAERRPFAPNGRWPVYIPLPTSEDDGLGSWVENGMVWEEVVAYQAPPLAVPPATLILKIARDRATPALVPDLGENVPAPTRGAHPEIALVGQLLLHLPLPAPDGVDLVRAWVDQLALKWPLPSLASAFRLEAFGADQQNLRFDAHSQQIQMTHVPIMLRQHGQHLQGALPFKLIATQGAALEGVTTLAGHLAVTLHHFALSQSQVQWFEATARERVPSQRVPIHYESTIEAQFELSLASPEAERHLVERCWTFALALPLPTLGSEVEAFLNAWGATYRRIPLSVESGWDYLWRTCLGQSSLPIRLDLRLRLWPPTPDAPATLKVCLNACSDAPWATLAAHLSQFERALKQYLHPTS